MTHDPADTHKARFDAYLDEAEREPEFAARRERIAALQARRPLHPFYGGPAVGVVIMAVGLLARWIGLW